MFEFYGWACISSDTYEIDDEADARLLANLEEKLEELQQSLYGLAVHLDTKLNGSLHALTVVGQMNHRRNAVIELFKWIGEHGPGSYGLLYVDDGEDYRGDVGYQDVFRVWRLARGKLEELVDPFLSPRIPTLEDPYDPERGG